MSDLKDVTSTLGSISAQKVSSDTLHLIMTHLWAKFSLLSHVADWSQAEIGYTAGRNISLLLIAKRVIARGLNAWLWRELPADANTQVNGENHTTEQKNNYFNNN